VPDLTGIPPGVSAPLLIAFAVLLLIERLMGIFEKYHSWKSKKLPTEELPSSEETGDEPTPAPASDITLTEKPSPSDTDIFLSTKLIFGYSFIGAVFFPLVNLIAVSIFAWGSFIVETFAYNLLSSMVFAIASSSFIAFFLSKKYEPIRKFVLVCLVSGIAVSGLISVPVNLGSLIISVNEHQE